MRSLDHLMPEPQPINELQQKLLALNKPESPFSVTMEGTIVTAKWNIQDPKWAELFRRAGLKEHYEMVVELDPESQTYAFEERTGTLTWQTEQTAEFDFNTDKIKDPVLEILTQAGWRPKKEFSFDTKRIGMIVGALIVLLGVGAIAVKGMSGVLGNRSNTTPTPTPSSSSAPSETPSTTPEESGAPSGSPTSSPKSSLTNTQTQNTNTNAEPSFSDVLTGTKVDSKGIVTQGQTTFTSNTATIYLSAFLNNAKSGNKVTATLKDNKTGKTFGPATTTIRASGKNIIKFQFIKPDPAWSPDDYTLTLKASTGDVQEISITVKP
jgi:hypothetical protein